MAEDLTEVLEVAVEIIVEVKEVIVEAIGTVSKEQKESPGELLNEFRSLSLEKTNIESYKAPKS